MTNTTARSAARQPFTLAALALLALLLHAGAARAQWATSGGGANINNTNTGNVGVGTATPAAKQHVVGNNGAADAAAPSALTVAGGAGGAACGSCPGTAGGGIFLTGGFGSNGWSGFAGNGGAISLTGGGGGTPLAGGPTSGTGGALNFFGGPGGSMNYGLPAGAGGALNLTGGTGGNNNPLTAAGGPGGSIVINGGAGGTGSAAGAGGNVILADQRGRVGVGTAAPLQKLQIGGNASTPSAAPDAISLGATYSSTAGVNPKLRLYDNNAGSVFGVGVSASQFDFMIPAGTRYVWSANGVEKMRLDDAGNLTVVGNLAAKYQDVAEWVPSSQKLTAGTVVTLDLVRPNHVLASATAYDTAVAGVVSEQPGIILGEAGEGKVKVATTGRVRVKVDATKGPIKIGDLLVTSDVAGVAMRSEPIVVGGRKMHSPGTIIGKALEPLAGGIGEIMVLLSLQ